MAVPGTDARSLGSQPGDRAGRVHAGPSGAALVTVVGGIVAVATATLWLWGHSPYARYLSHGREKETDAGVLTLALFALGWALMTLAMMLPSALPLIRSFALVTRQRAHRVRLQVVMVSTLVGLWVLFGVAVHRADLLLHAVVDRVGWLGRRPQWLAAAVLFVAGLYQLSDLRRRCLSRCQSPAGVIARHWTGERPAVAAARIGADYGLFCLGCCWTLMLLMFAVGAGNIAAMLFLGAAIAVEKNVPRARVLVAPLGPLLLLAGAGSAVSGMVR